jgi:hypothetical protein
MVGSVESEQIEIKITVDRDEAASMTYGKREKFLGKLAEEQLAKIVPARFSHQSASHRNRWKPYTRENLAEAFKEWARLHDGKAPAKKDWSAERDPESLWPRPSGESFIAAVKEMAQEDGISLKRTAPHKNDPEHLTRRAWHEVQSLRRLADGRVERAKPNPYVGSPIDEFVERWEPSADEGAEIEALLNSPDPGPYCLDCFHGSGCRPPEMSPWQYAVEVIGGLQLRTGGDYHATRSERAHFGRNRQMVTAGAADVHPEPSDPAASMAIETIDAH